MKWSESDNYFVTSSFDVHSVDLSSEPLSLVLQKDVIYDGPNSEEFKKYLLDNGLSVNRRGKAIQRAKLNDGDEYKFFLLERMVSLMATYGFTNLPSPMEEANELLSSIATIFEERNGLKINGMDTTTTTTSTSLSSTNPAPDLITESLRKLRDFISERFFIDASVIVKAYNLINQKDIPIIFRNSEAGVAELHRPDIAPKSIDCKSSSIFYGYFNIPWVGKLKGVLTKIDDDVTTQLPDEIKVKLDHLPYKLDDKRFWFVKANGEAFFEKFSSSDFLGFLGRMKNKTFVNNEGEYLKFEFNATTVKVSGVSEEIYNPSSVAYIDSANVIYDPFMMVQYDKSESPQPISEGRVSLPERFTEEEIFPFNQYLVGLSSTREVAFLVENLCFLGKITRVSDENFRNNALVTEFFERLPPGQFGYVDALAKTFFVCNPNKSKVLYKLVREAPHLLT
ncbi:hypothetical protein NE237_009866 [Protea cynaroides]|uniref:Uncharacterized protein n=1 Tax=Protea cynaroides TaxID=273540 RepID=A0A9Q0KZG3_9MAGN|nr:hypothetical protein NE237_009866 [Protea cynaroides]